MNARVSPPICSFDGCTKPRKYLYGLCDTHASRLRKHGDVSIVILPPTIDEMLWNKLDRSSGCWVWNGKKTKGGYGLITFRQKRWLTHRLSYFLTHGEQAIPMCLHTCDNPPCANPDHLFAGTQIDNMQDCRKKERLAYGEQIPWAKLTDAGVRQIWDSLNAGEERKMIADRFGVSKSNISNIARGLSWKHLKHLDQRLLA